MLPPGWTPLGSSTVDYLYSFVVGGPGRARTNRLHVAYSDASMIARARDLDDVLRQLEVDLQLCVAEESRLRLFVHAGVVGWNGEAILIPGRSRSGKSTLVASLVQAGATYYSDEYALLDGQGRVHAYPVPPAIGKRVDGSPQSRVPLDSLAGRIGSRPLPVGRVLVTSYRPGARWRPRRLGPSRAMLELLRHTVRARRAPGRAMDILSSVVSRGEVWRGVRGEACEVAARLLAGSNRPGPLRPRRGTGG